MIGLALLKKYIKIDVVPMMKYRGINLVIMYVKKNRCIFDKGRIKNDIEV